MITNPSQWQLDNIRQYDQVIVSKKSFLMKLIDFVSGITPEFVTIKRKSKDNKEYLEKADRRLVTILTQEEINSKVNSQITYISINKNGQSTGTRVGEATVSINQLILTIDNKIYSIPIDIIEQCIEKSKRKFNMLNDNSSSLDYNYISESCSKEFDFDGYRYEFMNGVVFKLIMYKRRDDTNKDLDKYVVIEDLFKLSVSGNDTKEVTEKLLSILSDRIKLALSKSNDKNYDSFLLENSLDNIIRKCVRVTKIN